MGTFDAFTAGSCLSLHPLLKRQPMQKHESRFGFNDLVGTSAGSAHRGTEGNEPFPPQYRGFESHTEGQTCCQMQQADSRWEAVEDGRELGLVCLRAVALGRRQGLRRRCRERREGQQHAVSLLRPYAELPPPSSWPSIPYEFP